MPCVCNDWTNPLVAIDTVPADSAGNITSTGNATVVETTATDPPLTMEYLEEEYPEIFDNLANQAEAPVEVSRAGEGVSLEHALIRQFEVNFAHLRFPFSCFSKGNFRLGLCSEYAIGCFVGRPQRFCTHIVPFQVKLWFGKCE